MKYFHEIIKMPVNNVILEGELTLPAGSDAIVIFCHGSGSSRFSPRNKAVAMQLQEYRFGTLLFDLLTEAEDEASYQTRFDIELLTGRLTGVTEWLESFPYTRNYKMGYFGASTGAAAAVKAAYYLPHIQAVVSRGGRPDLAANVLPHVITPTLLIVGGQDREVLEYNRRVYEQLQGPKKLLVVEGAGHLFQEGNSMDKVSEAAVAWFSLHLQAHVQT